MRKNPTSSTVLEAIQILAQIDPYFIESAEELAKDPDLCKKADDILKGKLYRDSKVTWYKAPRFANTHGIYKLSDKSFKLLFLLSSLMAQGSNLVKIGKDDICRILDVSEHTCKKCLKELKESGYIGVFKNAKRHDPPVYAVNPYVASCGKNVRLTRDLFMADKMLDNFCDLQVETETLTDENGQVRMVSVLREQTEKESASTTNADS